MSKLPPVAEGTYGTRRVLLYDSVVIPEGRVHKRIVMFTIEFIDNRERRVVKADDPNLKLWIRHEPCCALVN